MNEIGTTSTVPDKLILLLRHLWSIQIIRFFVVGGLNTLFGYTIYSILILISVHYSIAALISTVIGVVFNFFTTGRIVFKNHEFKLIFKFVIVYGIIYVVNFGFLSVFDYYKFNMIVAGAILLIPIAVLSYLLNKIIVFNKRNN